MVYSGFNSKVYGWNIDRNAILFLEFDRISFDHGRCNVLQSLWYCFFPQELPVCREDFHWCEY